MSPKTFLQFFAVQKLLFPLQEMSQRQGISIAPKFLGVPRCSTKYIKILTFTNVKYPVNKYKISIMKTRAIKVHIQNAKKERRK